MHPHRMAVQAKMYSLPNPWKGLSTICVYCRDDTSGIEIAELDENAWKSHATEVNERKCKQCRKRFHWWFFQFGGEND